MAETSLITPRGLPPLSEIFADRVKRNLFTRVIAFGSSKPERAICIIESMKQLLAKEVIVKPLKQSFCNMVATEFVHANRSWNSTNPGLISSKR